MAVRFLPPPEERRQPPERDRGDLAEVIEFRGLLAQQRWRRGADADAGADMEPGSAPDTEPAAEPDAAPARPSRAAEARAVLEAALASSAVDADRVSERGGVDDAGALAGSADVAPDDATSAETGRTPYEDGVRLLARKARSSGELREELVRLGHDAFAVDAVIDEFERGRYLDDEGLARAQAEKLRETKRASRSQIRMKLRERRLPDAAIEAALGDLDDDEEFALLREAAEDRARRLTGLDRQTAERRLLGFLARRGWSGEPAMRAARDALAGSGAGGSARSGRGPGRGGSGGVRFS